MSVRGCSWDQLLRARSARAELATRERAVVRVVHGPSGVTSRRNRATKAAKSKVDRHRPQRHVLVFKQRDGSAFEGERRIRAHAVHERESNLGRLLGRESVREELVELAILGGRHSGEAPPGGRAHLWGRVSAREAEGRRALPAGDEQDREMRPHARGRLVVGGAPQQLGRFTVAAPKSKGPRGPHALRLVTVAVHELTKRVVPQVENVREPGESSHGERYHLGRGRRGSS